MSSDRQTLLQNIKALQQLIPGDDYQLYIKQAQQQNLKFVSHHQFFPAMDEKSPGSLNDVELNVLSRSKKIYMDNIFTPIIIEKQASILKDRPEESVSSAIARWTEMIKKTRTPAQLKDVIEKINHRKKSSSNKSTQKKSFWKRMLGL